MNKTTSMDFFFLVADMILKTYVESLQDMES